MVKRVRTTRRLEVWLKDTSVALFVLNSQRRLVFFNVGCEQLTGWTPADVLGRVCDYVTESDAADSSALLASLAPPATVWTGQSTTVPVSLARRESGPIACNIHFYPLTDVERKVQAALGIIQQSVPVPTSGSAAISSELHAELAALRHVLKQRYSETSLIARSPAMRRVLGQMKLAQQSAVPVLFVGEDGSGRQYLARLIHGASEFGRRSFVPLDCRRIPADQLESALERMSGGANVDAFQVGTVYLDHVQTLPRDVQRIVLKMIESTSATMPRVMAASLRPLDPFVESGEFLSDLQFALTSLSLVVPPLRNRPEDMQHLAQFFLEELNRGQQHQVDGFHNDVWQQFRRYDWPGNVRELRAVVTDARNQCAGSLVETNDLPFRFRTGVDRQSLGTSSRRRPVPLDPLLLQVEREQIELALTEARHNKAKAAELLGITRPRLYRRMEILGIVDDESQESSGGSDAADD